MDVIRYGRVELPGELRAQFLFVSVGVDRGRRVTLAKFVYRPVGRYFSGGQIRSRVGEIDQGGLAAAELPLHFGTEGGGSVTTVGSGCAFLANSHVGHDCRVGNGVIFSNNVMLAGHCTVGDFAILGGGAAVIQYARVGHHAFVGGMSGLENDLIPYGMALGNRAYLSGLNVIGLQRRGFSRTDIHDLRRAYRLLFAAEGTLSERMEDVAEEFANHDSVQEILAFIRQGGKRSLCTPKNGTAD